MIAVKVDQVFLSNMGYVVLLKGLEDKRTVPIFIGPAEAQAIAIKLSNVELPRPMTHDLVKTIFDLLECRLQRVVVSEIKEGTFYASLVLERDGSEFEVDCRPSDAVALSLRLDAPVFVHEDVMNEAGRVIETPAPEGGSLAQQKKPQAEIKPLSPLDQLKQNLDKAVTDERYEDAAKLRDEIARLEHKHTGN